MATTQPQASHGFTVADLEVFPHDGKRYEVIDGELYVTHAPDLRHQTVIDRLVSALAGWTGDASGRGLAVSGPGVVFAFDTGVIPDLVWVSEERPASLVIDPATGRAAGRFFAAPDLLVEVVSPGAENERRDREVKLSLYARRGAREYWIVDYRRRTVEIHRRAEPATLAPAERLGEAAVLTSPLLPGFTLPVARIFALPPGLAALLAEDEE